MVNQYLRLAAALGARTSGAAAGDGVTAAAATAAAAAADGAAAPSQLHGMAGNLYPVFVTETVSALCRSRNRNGEMGAKTGVLIHSSLEKLWKAASS